MKLQHPFSILLEKLPLFAAFLLMSLAPAHADEVKTSLQVLCISPPDNAREVYLKTGKDQPEQSMPKAEMSSTRFPDAFDYRGAAGLTLFSRQKKKGYKPMASVTLSPSWKQTIIVLSPAPEDSELPYQAVALDGSLKSFKAGTRLVVNMSKDSVRGEMGAQPFTRDNEGNLKFECEAEKSEHVPVLDPEAKPLTSNPVILEHKAEDTEDTDDWRMLTTTRWFHTPTQRHLVVVYQDKKRKTLVLHGITDRVKTK